jgi:hypothetical protein
VVHTPTGTIWNRKAEELSIADGFTDVLESLGCCRIPWLNCQALERRQWYPIQMRDADVRFRQWIKHRWM